MKRLLALAVALVLFAASMPRAWGQFNTRDTVEYTDPATKGRVVVDGKISKEGPGGITIQGLVSREGPGKKMISEGNQVKQVPSLAITHVTYAHPKVGSLEYRAGFTKESRALDKRSLADKKAGLHDAIASFREVAGKLQDAPPAFRYLQYRIARARLELARLEPDNKVAMKTALDALTEFKDKYQSGWEIVPTLTTLARLQEEQGNLDEARRAYEALTVVPDAPPELKREGELQVAQMYVRAKRYVEAEVKLNGLLAATPANDPQRGLLRVYLAESKLAQNKVAGVEEDLKAALATSGDNARIKATAHNMLGDYYRAKKQDEEALWEYLKVDALYNQDRDEHAKALYYLSRLFQSVQGNRFRSQQCLERLQDKSFVGSDYHRKALTEAPPMR